MERVLIWTPESDTDSKAVCFIAEKIINYYGIELQVNTGTKEGFNQVASRPDGLMKAVNIYLKNHRLVIFLLDADGLQSQERRKREENSLINKVNKVVKQSKGKAVLVLIKQELEAWLLVDYLGICCFFTKDPKNREREKWIKFAKKHQIGKTDLITEAELGGKNAKEYLMELSRKILQIANPNLDKKDLKKNRYSEQISDQVAQCIEINKISLSRNDSLAEFADYLKSEPVLLNTNLNDS